MNNKLISVCPNCSHERGLNPYEQMEWEKIKQSTEVIDPVQFFNKYCSDWCRLDHKNKNKKVNTEAFKKLNII